MVKVERSFPAPASLAEEAKKVNGKYDRQDVIERLRQDFHNKCYICEMKGLQDPNVEHLLPHKSGKYQDRKYDWENLFWSCGHCNGIKNSSKYDEGIIDCCNTDPERYLHFRMEGSNVAISVSDPKDEILKRTAQLERVHNGSGSKTAVRTLRSLLRRESAFAAFKRSYVRDHAAEYPELQQYVALEDQ